MSEKLPEDRQIRERLAMRRLEEVLSCQHRERDDRLFNRQCLFCRYQAKGNRYTVIFLNAGSSSFISKRFFSQIQVDSSFVHDTSFKPRIAR